MDPSIFLNYEIVHETLSASESDSEITSDHTKSDQKEGIEKKKKLQNFIICQPIAINNYRTDTKKKNNDKGTQFDHLDCKVERYPDVGERDNGFYGHHISTETTSRIVEPLGVTNRQTAPNSDHLPKTSIKHFKSLSKDPVENINEEGELSRQNWSNIVNSIGSDGPSMKKIKKVIKKTICKVLNEDLPCKGKSTLFDTTKKNCPHCQFSTLSRFLFKKHVALHENNPELIFSEGLLENSLDVHPLNLKYQCHKCFDLFRTETGLKYHKHCGKLEETSTEEEKMKEMLEENLHSVQLETPLVDGDSILITALKFLNKKPIDLETTKEMIDPSSEDDKTDDAGFEYLKEVVSEEVIIRDIKKEITEAGPIVDDLETKNVIIKGKNDSDIQEIKDDKTNNGNTRELMSENSYHRQPDESKSPELNGACTLNRNQTRPNLSGKLNYLEDLQVNWRAKPKRVSVKKNQQNFLDERLQFNKLISTWLKSYQELYPSLSARVHVPGGVPCPECKIYYKSFHLLKRHWGRIHDPSASVLSCSFCTYKTKQTDLLDSHIKNMHDLSNKKNYPCDKCNKIYQTKHRLKEHIQINHSDKTKLVLHKCEMCTFSSYHRSNLKRHFERKHLNVGKRYLCMFCGCQRKSEEFLKKHELIHLGVTNSFNCNECPQGFGHRLDLYSHHKIAHSSDPIYFNCCLCEFKTVNKELLVVHNNVTHKHKPQFKCSDCSLILKDMNSLSQHINRKHNPYLSWKYCYHCSYKSLKKAAIYSHIVKHLPRKTAPIKCKLCKYRTYKRHYYVRHFNNRHNPNAVLYECFHCGYANKVKAKLHQHMLEKRHILKG